MSDEQAPHHWTAEEVKARLWTDADLRDLKRYENPFVNATFDFLVQNEISKPDSLLKQMPQIRLMTEKTRNGSSAPAYATITQSGTPYIMVNPNFTRPGAYTDQEVLSVLTHELGHLVKGHATLQGFVDLYNGVDTIPRETEADIYAVARCQGQGLVSLLESARDRELAAFDKDIANAGRSFEEWQRQQSPDHPTKTEAIDEIKNGMQAASHCLVPPKNGQGR